MISWSRALNFYREARGFTLGEVLVTITITGILFAIAAASWQNVVESRRVDSATNQVKADLRLAHTSASNRLGAARLIFNGNGSPVTCNGQSAAYCLVEPIPSGGTVQRPRNFESNTIRLTSPNLFLASGPITIEFAANGTASTVGAALNAGLTGVTDRCPSSTPSGVPRIQVSSNASNPTTHCLTFNIATSSIKVD
ncbi:prepilin-type N-terminal cleavage/methylation domain-containing protein [Rubrobacter marinus]|uniref:Prepilin-type N-terminal cleavage/methylation domain-containing protein n=1 Tax=Rubrobacter marinus TaxID=2653852 RepID=A0A6G8PUZ2_9ACTN|nr:prepilin-type N-terminal cleavage/methylation domain-containing protein [Rubrobacter marinus]